MTRTDEEPRTQRWRTERRAAIRRHHPDRGGSEAELTRALDEVDRRHGVGDTARASRGPEQPEVVVVHSRIRLVGLGLRQMQALLRKVRGQLPRGWPGARRVTRL